MFVSAAKFNNGSNGNIAKWDSSKVTIMQAMFTGSAAFNQNLSDWDTSKVTSCNEISNSFNLWINANRPNFKGCTP